MFIEELIGAIGQLFIFSLIPFIWWLITARKKENFFKWIGLKKIKHEGKWIYTVLITLGALVAYIFFTWLIMSLIKDDAITTAGSNFAGSGAAAIPAVIVYGFIRTGLSEEIIFRGFLGKRIAGKFGFVTGNIIQAVLFGFMHGVPFGLATHNILVTVLLTILPGLFGFYQGWLNEKRCGGSIVSSWLLHGTMNTIVALLAL